MQLAILIRPILPQHRTRLLSCRHHYMSATNSLDRLKKRGLIANYFPEDKSEDLSKFFANPPSPPRSLTPLSNQSSITSTKTPAKSTTAHPSIYCGFDPTSDSLHLGNLLSLILLIHAQRAGFQPIALIGGATAEIGDPSGKTKDRPQLEKEVIDQNVEGIRQNILDVFHNHQEYIYNNNNNEKFQNKRSLLPIKILDNRDWYKDKNVIDFLCKVGRHFRMGNMLSRSSVQCRLTSADGLCLTEFLYQMFQAYDWYHLHKHHNCRVQIGGGDQMGNIVSGFEFLNKVSKTPVYGITTPLITTSTGDKLGKSAGNAVWLAPSKTSPFELYQHLIRTPDADLAHHLHLFTLLSEQRCFDAVVDFKRNPSKRSAHKILAEEVVKLVHGERGIQAAKECTEALYSGSIEKLAVLDRETFKSLFKGAPLTCTLLHPGTTLLQALLAAKCFRDQRDAERVVVAGGVTVNHQRITNPHSVLTPGTHILPNNFTVIRVGKKNYHIIDWLGTGFHAIEDSVNEQKTKAY